MLAAAGWPLTFWLGELLEASGILQNLMPECRWVAGSPGPGAAANSSPGRRNAGLRYEGGARAHPTPALPPRIRRTPTREEAPSGGAPRSLSKLEGGPLSKPSTLLGNRVLAFLPPGLITGPSSAHGSGVGACTPTGPPGRPPHAWREEPQSSKVLVSEPSDTAGGGQRARLPWGPALPFLARAHPGEVRTQECRSPSRPPRPSTRGGMNKTRSVRAMDDDSAREVG